MAITPQDKINRSVILETNRHRLTFGTRVFGTIPGDIGNNEPQFSG